MAHHATEHIDEAAWLAMVSHPFRLQAGGQRIDQQLCYFGTLLQVWDDAADVGMVKPWPPVLHQMRSTRAIEFVVRMESTRGVIEPGSSRAIPLVMRMECGSHRAGSDACGPSSR